MKKSLIRRLFHSMLTCRNTARRCASPPLLSLTRPLPCPSRCPLRGPSPKARPPCRSWAPRAPRAIRAIRALGTRLVLLVRCLREALERARLLVSESHGTSATGTPGKHQPWLHHGLAKLHDGIGHLDLQVAIEPVPKISAEAQALRTPTPPQIVKDAVQVNFPGAQQHVPGANSQQFFRSAVEALALQTAAGVLATLFHLSVATDPACRNKNTTPRRQKLQHLRQRRLPNAFN